MNELTLQKVLEDLNLTKVQRQELILIYKIAEEECLFLDDYMDLKSMCNFIIENIDIYRREGCSIKNLNNIIREIVVYEYYNEDVIHEEEIYDRNAAYAFLKSKERGVL